MNVEWELKRFVRLIRPGLIGARSNANLNLTQLIEEIKTVQSSRDQFAKALEDFLLTQDFVAALTETGLTLETGVFSEVFKRLEYKVLPKATGSNDILNFISKIFSAQSDADWLEEIDRQKFGEFLSLLFFEHRKLVDALAPQILISLEILSLRLAGIGYDPVVSQRLRSSSEFQTAFMDVTRHVYALLDQRGEQSIPAIREALSRCQRALIWIRSRRGVDGISLALTFRMMRIRQILERMELVLELTEAVLTDWTPEPARELFFEIVLAEIRRFNVRRFFSESFELLAYQITEHTGKAGEHYITRNRSEWKMMFRSATIGGVVVGVLVVMKYIGHNMHLPPGPSSIIDSLIYAVGFVFIHAVGGTVATKQPAMTASTLAGALDGAANSEQALESLSEVVVRTIRSQLIAVLGNYLFAFPTAALLTFALMKVGWPILHGDKAQAVLTSLHPFKSLSVWYAALAGVGLFVSGLLAGIADNWFVFNRVGERLKNSELLRSLVGLQNLDHAIHTIDHNLGFWVGNICLGFYLGTMPWLGVIFGLPLDARHISFCSGQFGAGLTSLSFQITAPLFFTFAIGIFCFGLVNLSVSFSLTLFVAIRSRKIRFSQTPQLMKLLGRRFRRRPLDFFIPARDTA